MKGRLSEQRPRYLEVETTMLDNVFGHDDHIDFLKVDVQGAEHKVLLGAKHLLENGQISMQYVEWSGATSVVEILKEHGFIVFDSMYVGTPKRGDVSLFQKMGFEVVGEIALSTGVQALEMIFSHGLSAAGSALRKARREGLGWIQTDLIAVEANAYDEFVHAARRVARLRTDQR